MRAHNEFRTSKVPEEYLCHLGREGRQQQLPLCGQRTDPDGGDEEGSRQEVPQQQQPGRPRGSGREGRLAQPRAAAVAHGPRQHRPAEHRSIPTCMVHKVARWQNLIPSFPWIVPGWRAWGRNPRKGRDQILQRSVTEP